MLELEEIKEVDQEKEKEKESDVSSILSCGGDPKNSKEKVDILEEEDKKDLDEDFDCIDPASLVGILNCQVKVEEYNSYYQP